MARKALKVSCLRKQEALEKALKSGKKPKFSTRVYNRCKVTGRRHGFIRFFGMSRIVFRKLASQGLLPGVTKSSW
jgi:small subunit ribosomal protein S14